ncbi:hypothetical protein BgiMline_031947, partial [Biomphalaria glabrata]
FVSDQAVLKLGLDEVYKLTIISTGQKRILYVYFKPGQCLFLHYCRHLETSPSAETEDG